MLWKTEEKKKKTTPTLAEPEKVKFSDIGIVDSEYKQLSAKIGVISYESIIRECVDSVYPIDSVFDYLDKKYKDRYFWKWVPLRKRDIIKGRNFNDTDRRTYAKPIPYAVLVTIDKLQTACLDFKFFISDELDKSDIKDPFLLVTADMIKEYWIVERWDEPSFR